MTGAKVQVSIVNWNGGDSILSCLEDLEASSYREFHVLVVDNASSDGSVERVAQRFPAVQILRNVENRGFTGGQNQALEMASERGFEFAWMLNCDIAMEPGTLGTLVALLEANPRVALASPVILDARTAEQIQFCGGSIDWDHLSFRNYENVADAVVAQSEEPSTSFVWGTALLVRIAAIREFGRLDEQFFAYYEDLDLSVRSVRAGYLNVVVPEARIRHWGQIDWSQRSALYVYYNVRNRARFWTKHLPQRQRLRYWRDYLAGVLVTAAGFRRAGDPHKADAVLTGASDAIKGRGGAFDSGRRIPWWLSIAERSCPYMLANVLRGNFGAVLRRRFRRKDEVRAQ